jgi:hypothetical protein
MLAATNYARNLNGIHPVVAYGIEAFLWAEPETGVQSVP